jgi:molybdate/tungstate transport system substrate-binding protein
MKHLSLLFIIIPFLQSGCGGSRGAAPAEIIIFHAGSLSVPFNKLKNEYEKMHPEVKILLEPAGSLVCARKITELKKPCDIIASADYYVINELLIPQYAKWSIKFATNEIVVAFTDKSKYASDINKDNWTDILLREDVRYSRSDPNADPCGYRSVFTIMLAEKLYGKSGLTEKMLAKDRDFIRPKEVDLIALIESNACDYMFQYKSVAIQHGLKYLDLPSDINLSDPGKADLYKSVSIDVTGNKPGTKMRMTGDYINYSMTVPESAPEKNAALDFMCFILSERGLEIFRENGQSPIIPFSTEQHDQLPAKLLQYLPAEKKN